MKNIFIAFIAVLSLLLTPLAAAQANLYEPGEDSEQMQEMMGMMAEGELDANSQMLLSEKLNSGKLNGEFYSDRMMRDAKFSGKTYNNFSGLIWLAVLGQVLFGILVLLFLFLLNAVLYKKLTMMNGKKK